MNPALPRLLTLIVALFVLAGCSAEKKKARLLERAERSFQAANYETAQIEFLNLLQLDPENPSATGYLSRIWMERGAPLRALPYVQKLRLQSPTHRSNQRALVAILLSLGKVSDLRKEATAILASVPDDEEALLALAHTARSAEDHKAVEEALKRADRNKPAYHLASAHLLVRRGAASEARLPLLRAREIAPESPKVHTEFAAYHFALNQREEAAKALKAAADAAPLRSLERLRYAEYLMQSGAAPEGIALLKGITEKAPDYLPAWRALAYVAIVERKYDEAQGFLDRIFRIDASNYDARIARARLLVAKGELKPAIEDLEKLGAQYPALAEDKFVLGQLLAESGETGKAIAALKRAMAQNPHLDSAVLLFAKLSLAAGDAESAGKAVTALLVDRPNLLSAQALLLESMRALGKLDAVVQSLRAQIKAIPAKVELHRLLALILKQQGKIPEARASMEHSLELTPGFLPIVAELVALDLEAKDFTSAQRRVKQQLDHAPNHAGGHFLQARVLAAEARWSDAIPVLLRSVDLDPDYTASYELLSRALAAQPPSSAMVAQLDQFLAKRPDNFRAALLVGGFHSQAKQYQQAAAAYEKHLQARPDSLIVMNNLAYLYADNLAQSDRALELARRARKLEPTGPVIADTLGWILYQRKEYGEALELFQEAAAKLPKNGEVQYHLGLAHQALGQTDPAREAFQKAAQASGDFAGKHLVAQKLAELGTVR